MAEIGSGLERRIELQGAFPRGFSGAPVIAASDGALLGMLDAVGFDPLLGGYGPLRFHLGIAVPAELLGAPQSLGESGLEYYVLAERCLRCASCCSRERSTPTGSRPDSRRRSKQLRGNGDPEVKAGARIRQQRVEPDGVEHAQERSVRRVWARASWSTTFSPSVVFDALPCCTLAPVNFSLGPGPVQIVKQPIGAEEQKRCELALLNCPGSAIGRSPALERIVR